MQKSPPEAIAKEAPGNSPPRGEWVIVDGMPSCARVTVAVVLLSLTPSVARAQQPPAPPPGPPGELACDQGIDEATTRKVFDSLVAPGAGDGCVLEAVRTERTQMQIVWKKDGQLVETVMLAPTSCAGPTATTRGKRLAITAPPAATAACPSSLGRLQTLVQGDAISSLVSNGGSDTRSWRLYVTGALGLLVLGLLIGWWLVQRRGKRLRDAAKLGIWLVAGWVTLELGLRGYVHWVHPIGRLLSTLFRADADVGFALAPDLHTTLDDPAHEIHFTADTNEDGLRGHAPTPARQPGEARVLVLGDSYAFGLGVESDETFAALLETRLRASRPVRVLNAGVPGYGTAQELAYYEHRGERLAPDLVLLAFYQNDFEDNMKHYVFTNGFLMRDPLLVFGQPSFAIEFLAKKILHPTAVLLTGDGWEGAVDESRTRALLARLQARCREQHRPFVVLNIPDREQTKYAGNPPDLRGARAAPMAGMIDLLPLIQASDATPYLRDGHLNRHGHALAAEVLTPVVASSLPAG
jgi:hypothetical protein